MKRQMLEAAGYLLSISFCIVGYFVSITLLAKNLVDELIYHDAFNAAGLILLLPFFIAAVAMLAVVDSIIDRGFGNGK